MIVDDDADMRTALGFCLSSEGYQVHLCTNGHDAVDRLDFGLRPDAIVLDLMMPAMNGFELLQALKSNLRWSSIPVVVASVNRGYTAQDLGVATMLRKPFDLPDLLRAIESAARRTGGTAAPAAPASAV